MSQPLFANHRVRVKQNICTLIKRSLKGPGSLIVQKNTEISPHDILGHYKLTLGFTKINLAKELNVTPMEVPKLLQKAVGQTIFKGELVAFKKGLLSKAQIISPTDGIFESLDEKTGEATFKLLPKDVSLTAGVFGVVQDVDFKKGEVTIKTMMTEVYGIYGTGGEREGFINVISGPADLVNKEFITENHRGQILIAGSLILEAVIRESMSCNVSGIIGGGLNLDDYLAMGGSLEPQKTASNDSGISILATEGFGIIPMGDDIYELFKKYSGKYALINGNLGRVQLPSNDPNSILSCRKVGLPSYETIPEKVQLSVSDIKIGVKVRLIAPPFMGSQGTVLEIDSVPTRLESGISTILVTVVTKNKKIRVAFSNLEIID